MNQFKDARSSCADHGDAMNRHAVPALRRPGTGLFVRGWMPLLALIATMPAQAEPTALDAVRSQALVRMVRQDCGSCHGMHLTGGLGPALTPAALAGRPLEMLVAVIHRGRPGTPMPGWQSLLSEAEAKWIAERLLAGFPEEIR